MAESPDQLHVRFRDAFNRQDLDGVIALYEQNAILVTADGPVRGRDAIREAYRGFFAMHPTIDLETTGVNGTDNLAMLHGRWVVERSSVGEQPSSSHGRNTEVARRQADGRWLFVIDNPSVP